MSYFQQKNIILSNTIPKFRHGINRLWWKINIFSFHRRHVLPEVFEDICAVWQYRDFCHRNNFEIAFAVWLLKQKGSLQKLVRHSLKKNNSREEVLRNSNYFDRKSFYGWKISSIAYYSLCGKGRKPSLKTIAKNKFVNLSWSFVYFFVICIHQQKAPS